jgi:hypothetical protein
MMGFGPVKHFLVPGLHARFSEFEAAQPVAFMRIGACQVNQKLWLNMLQDGL